MGKIFVNKRIELANTLPSEFYTNEEFYNLTKEKIFLKSWQWIDSKGINKKDKIIIPINILEELINEPIILLKNNDEILAEVYISNNELSKLRDNIIEII